MSVDKVILRAFLSTLAAIGALLLFLVLTLCIAFPSTMMEFTYKLGMEDTCIHFAKRAYNNSDDIYYIAYATEVAIEEDKTGKILSLGTTFLEDEEFERYCQARDEKGGYRQFIYGQVSVAKYEKQDADGAIELAYNSLNGEFPEGNALIAVLVKAMEWKDTQTITKIKEKMQTLAPTDSEYLNGVLALLS